MDELTAWTKQEIYNNDSDLMAYFSVKNKKCYTKEYLLFWNSLTWMEKLYFRRAPLT